VRNPKDEQMLQKATLFGAGMSPPSTFHPELLDPISCPLSRLFHIRLSTLATRLHFLHSTHSTQTCSRYPLVVSV
jgi:hypothetical protein